MKYISFSKIEKRNMYEKVYRFNYINDGDEGDIVDEEDEGDIVDEEDKEHEDFQ
jgi:hypothetical protein